MCQLSVVESKSATFPSEKARHLLDDSVLESRSPRRGLALASSSAVTNGLSLGKRLRPPPAPRAAAGGRGPACAHVCPSLCSVRQPCSGRRGFAEGPWVRPHPAGGPEHGRQGEGAARHTQPGPAVVGRQLSGPPRDSCPWGSHRPQRAGQSRGSRPRTAARWATGSSRVSLSSHGGVGVREDEKGTSGMKPPVWASAGSGAQASGGDGGRAGQSRAEAAGPSPCGAQAAGRHCPPATPFPHACASVVLVSVCLSASLRWQQSWGPWRV